MRRVLGVASTVTQPVSGSQASTHACAFRLRNTRVLPPPLSGKENPVIYRVLINSSNLKSAPNARKRAFGALLRLLELMRCWHS